MEEGKISKGGVGTAPTTPRPEPPKGQGGSLQEELAELKKDNMKLRKLLWLVHGCLSLYGDDGEMQCNCGNHKPIDFKRDSLRDINQKLMRF